MIPEGEGEREYTDYSHCLSLRDAVVAVGIGG